MNTVKQKSRSDIPEEYKWNISAMYPDESDVDRDMEIAKTYGAELAKMQGSVMSSADTLLAALETYSDGMRYAEKAFVYAHMKHDEDNSDSKYTEMYGKAVSSITAFGAAASFLEPEILSADASLIDSYIAGNSGLGQYSFMLKQIMHGKEHVLSPDQEYVLASLREVLDAPDSIYSALCDADMVFGTVTDSDGKVKDLTHSTYIGFMESKDRRVRKEAFDRMYETYKAHNNALSAMYSANVRHDAINAGLRKYSSSLEAKLSPSNIALSVYDNLIGSVHAHLPAMHKYVSIRKRLLGLSDMSMWDVYVPVASPDESSYAFEEAVDIISEALEPMGEEYVSVLRRGLLEEKWADVLENKGKTSGAYSFGSYDSYPYMLLNYTGRLRDLFTLIHESGHSMHSHYTRETQPYIYGDHSIFTAEVASTVNENLLMRYLLDRTDDPKLLSYLINFYIDEFKGTVFRQTMFAEFERAAHEYVEQGGSLSAEWLNSEYDRLNTMYFGPEMTHDDMIQYEWSRIPHFYSSYYVYQYATGFSAANAIAHKILSEGESARDSYIEFLRTGSSDYPIELLRIAGVDMDTPQPVMTALDTFDELVDRLDALTH